MKLAKIRLADNELRVARVEPDALQLLDLTQVENSRNRHVDKSNRKTEPVEKRGEQQ